MKSIKGKVLLSVIVDQKTDFEMDLGDTGIRIWMTHGGFDAKITGAVLARVEEDYEQYHKGQWVLTHHNAFTRDINDKKERIGDTGIKTEDRRRIYAIEENLIFLTVDKDGNAEPTDKYLIADSIDVPMPKTELIVLPEELLRKTYNDRFIVKAAHADSMFRKGDLIYTDQYAGLRIHYVFNHKELMVIRVAEEDVLAMEEREQYT